VSGRHALLVHTAAERFDVVADVGDHAVPLVALPALVRGGAASRRSVAVGGGIGGGAGCASVTTEAVCDDAAAVLHPDGLEEILKVLAVLLWYEGSQACRGTLHITMHRVISTSLRTDETGPLFCSNGFTSPVVVPSRRNFRLSP